YEEAGKQNQGNGWANPSQEFLRLELEVLRDKLDRLQRPVDFQEFIVVRNVANDDRILPSSWAAGDLAFDLWIVGGEFDSIETQSFESQQPGRGLYHKNHPALRLTLDLDQRRLQLSLTGRGFPQRVTQVVRRIVRRGFPGALQIGAGRDRSVLRLDF